MSQPLRVRYVYDNGTEFHPENAVYAWRPRTPSTGGSRIAAAGGEAEASYVIRRDKLLGITHRIDEDGEWAAFEAMVEWAQVGPERVTVYLDYPAVSVGVDCFIYSPKAGEELDSNRSGTFGQHYEPQIVWRRLDGQSWDQQYFIEDPAAS